MSLWKIAWRSIQHRALASGLTMLSMTMGVALVVAVLVIYGVIAKSFQRSAQGYDLIVGAEGSSLQLVLNTVYHLSRPVGNIPYDYYMDLAHGRFSEDVEVAIPVCMGGNFKGFRVVGTVPGMFKDLEYMGGEKYEFAEGRNFRAGNFFEAVIGSTVARRTRLKVGDTFRPVHGFDAEQGEEHDPFTVVGILAPTGTPNDRALFINIEGFYQVHEEEHHAAENGEVHDEGGAEHDHAHEEHPDEAAEDDPTLYRKVTAVLVLTDMTRPGSAIALPRLINREAGVQAVAPTEVIDELFAGIVGNVQKVLLILAVLIVIVAGIGMLVSIYNSMSDRRHEIAVMRALGARRVTVMMIVLFESILLALGGGFFGVVLGHGLTAALAPLILEHTGVMVNAMQFQPNELVLIPGLVLLAIAFGYLPAAVAYRTDVAEALAANP